MRKLFLAFSSPANFILVLGILAVLPFLLLTLYIHPTMDDFAYATRDMNTGFFAAQAKIYLTWSGRYFGTAMSRLNPIMEQDFVRYKVYAFVLILLFISATLFLFHSLLGQLRFRHKAALSLLVFSVYLMQLPDIAQGFYWLMAYMAHLSAVIYTLVLLGVLLQLESAPSNTAKRLLQALGLLLVFAIVGSNEMSLIMLNAMLLLLLLTQWQLHKKLSAYHVCLFLVAFALGLVVVLAPGNYARMAGQVKSGSLLFSVAGAGMLTFFSFVKWGFVLLLMSLIYLFTWAPSVYHHTKEKGLFKASIPLAPAWYLLTVFVMHFIHLYATGFRAGSRVENVMYAFFLFGWLHLLQVIINRYGDRLLHVIPAKPGAVATVLMAMFTIQTFSLESNVTTAYLDIVSGRAATFDQELNARYRYLKKTDCSPCPITPVSVLPKSLYIFSALRPDEVEEMGINNDYAAFWGKSATYLTGPTPAIQNNLTTLKDIGKKLQKQLFNIDK